METVVETHRSSAVAVLEQYMEALRPFLGSEQLVDAAVAAGKVSAVREANAAKAVYDEWIAYEKRGRVA